MFPMPPGTNSAKVLSAVQNLCREEFALKHRYVMALHTDEPHPHVHVVVKAIGDNGTRLNIKKATLPMLLPFYWRDKRGQLFEGSSHLKPAMNHLRRDAVRVPKTR
jgi:hypothetical protein